MLHDDQAPAPTHAAEWSATIQRTVKQRAAVQREVGRLLDALAPERPPARHDVPTPAIRQHRAPGRCILQADARAVTVSWFPARADADSLGEVVVISWRGTVSHPGGASRATGHAEPLDTINLQPVEVESGTWEWHSDRGTPALATEALATYCRTLLSE